MKILLIEDNLSILKALSAAFESKNITIVSCLDGLEGFKKLKKDYFDLAIIDLELPGMNGEEIIKAVKILEAKTPLLVLTANDDINKKSMLLNLDILDYVEKPYSFDELYARIMAIFRRKNGTFPSEYLSLDGLRLAPERRAVIRDGKEIVLNAKEYELLKYLMSHPNVVVNRFKLMNEVWGYSSSTLSNTVATHIARLRKKINKDYDVKLIQTIYRAGYILCSAR